MNEFKFHKVGQGLFYTGSLAHRTYNFVYDCGTDSKQQNLSLAIDSYVRDLSHRRSYKPKINFVVLSHLHRDHFSGLYKLAQQTNIAKVYLPYLGADSDFVSFVLFYVVFISNRDSDVNREELYTLYQFMLYLYRIEERGDFPQIESVFLEERAELFLNKDGFTYSTHEEDVCVEKQQYWKFVFVSSSMPNDKIEMLNNRVCGLLNDYNVTSIRELIAFPNGIDEIAEIYKRVFNHNKGSKLLNNISIVLMHYPVFDHPKVLIADDEDCRYFDKPMLAYKNRRICCLNGFCLHTKMLRSPLSILTGDIMLNDALKQIILSQMCMPLGSGCGVLQVPHHGAKDSWNAWGFIDSEVCVIPFGLGNRYGHPHAQTIENILKTENTIRLVTQIQDFIYYIV